MRTLRMLPLLLLPLLAGCTGGGQSAGLALESNGVPDQERVPGTYWMVWVHGEERAVREAPDYACDVAFDHAVDAGNRTVRYLDGPEAGDRRTVQVLLAYDLWETWSDCPIEYALEWDPAPLHERRFGRYGLLDLEVRDDGTLLVEGHEVPLGKAAVLRYAGTKPAEDWPRVQMEGEVRIENLGARGVHSGRSPVRTAECADRPRICAIHLRHLRLAWASALGLAVQVTTRRLPHATAHRTNTTDATAR